MHFNVLSNNVYLSIYLYVCVCVCACKYVHMDIRVPFHTSTYASVFMFISGEGCRKSLYEILRIQMLTKTLFSQTVLTKATTADH